MSLPRGGRDQKPSSKELLVRYFLCLFLPVLFLFVFFYVRFVLFSSVCLVLFGFIHCQEEEEIKKPSSKELVIRSFVCLSDKSILFSSVPLSSFFGLSVALGFLLLFSAFSFVFLCLFYFYLFSFIFFCFALFSYACSFLFPSVLICSVSAVTKRRKRSRSVLKGAAHQMSQKITAKRDRGHFRGNIWNDSPYFFAHPWG